MPRQRTVSLEDYILYVNPLGNDNNCGESLFEPLKTPQVAVDRMALRDSAEFQGTISLASGSYPGFELKRSVGLKDLIITGNGASTVIEDVIGASNIPYPFLIQSLKRDMDGANGVELINSVVELHNIIFESNGAATACIWADEGSGVYLSNRSITVNAAGGTLQNLFLVTDHSWLIGESTTLSLGAVPNFSRYAFEIVNLSLIKWHSPTITGTATGDKALISANSILDLNRSIADIPGDGNVIQIDGGRLKNSGNVVFAAGAPKIVFKAYDATYTAGAKTAKQQGLPIIVFRSNDALEGDDMPDSNLEISPENYDFGVVEEGNSSPQIGFIIKNTGGDTVTVQEIGISGGVSGDFTLTDVDCGTPPFSLAGGRACTVNVQFTPGDIENTESQQTRTANLIAESNAGNEKITQVPISGIAKSTRGSLEWSQANTQLPPVEQGQTGTPITLTLRNPGKTSVPYAEIGISGKDTSAFSVNLSPSSNPCGASGTLNPGDFCNIQVSATPPVEADSQSADVPKNATVEARSSDEDVPTAVIDIFYTATERPPLFHVAPSEFVTSGGPLTNANTVAQTITLDNFGTGDLRIISARIENTTQPTQVVTAKINDPTYVGAGTQFTTIQINTNAYFNRVTPYTISLTEGSVGDNTPPYVIAGANSKDLAVTFLGAAIADLLEAEYGAYEEGGQASPSPFAYGQYFSVAMVDLVIDHNDPKSGELVDPQRGIYQTRITIACQIDLP